MAVAFHCTHSHTHKYTYTPKRLLWLDIYFISINTDFLFFRTTTTTWLYFCRWQCEDDDDSLSSAHTSLQYTAQMGHILLLSFADYIFDTLPIRWWLWRRRRWELIKHSFHISSPRLALSARLSLPSTFLNIYALLCWYAMAVVVLYSWCVRH